MMLENKTQPHVTIIILNWNGWKDTIECLESVLKLNYPDFNIILIDNHSTNNSLEKIGQWVNGKLEDSIDTNFPDLIYPFEKKPVDCAEIESSDGLLKRPDIYNKKLLIIKNKTNLGFAKANNLGMKIAKNLYKSSYYLLLNNDTVIEKNSLKQLITTLENNTEIGLAQSTIYYYDNPSKIANAGGRIFFWGQTKYYKSINKNEIKRITFINGCALCIRSSIIDQFGYLSEKFFFGEEDFEFSYRLKRLKISIVNVGNSIIYHKVGISSKVLFQNYERLVSLFALNRIIDLRDYYSFWIWSIWRYFALIYFTLLLIFKYKKSFLKSVFLMYKINIYINHISNVDKNTINKIFKDLGIC